MIYRVLKQMIKSQSSLRIISFTKWPQIGFLDLAHCKFSNLIFYYSYYYPPKSASTRLFIVSQIYQTFSSTRTFALLPPAFLFFLFTQVVLPIYFPTSHIFWRTEFLISHVGTFIVLSPIIRIFIARLSMP